MKKERKLRIALLAFVLILSMACIAFGDTATYTESAETWSFYNADVVTGEEKGATLDETIYVCSGGALEDDTATLCYGAHQVTTSFAGTFYLKEGSTLILDAPGDSGVIAEERDYKVVGEGGRLIVLDACCVHVQGQFDSIHTASGTEVILDGDLVITNYYSYAVASQHPYYNDRYFGCRLNDSFDYEQYSYENLSPSAVIAAFEHTYRLVIDNPNQDVEMQSGEGYYSELRSLYVERAHEVNLNGASIYDWASGEAYTSDGGIFYAALRVDDGYVYSKGITHADATSNCAISGYICGIQQFGGVIDIENYSITTKSEDTPYTDGAGVHYGKSEWPNWNNNYCSNYGSEAVLIVDTDRAEETGEVSANGKKYIKAENGFYYRGTANKVSESAQLDAKELHFIANSEGFDIYQDNDTDQQYILVLSGYIEVLGDGSLGNKVYSRESIESASDFEYVYSDKTTFKNCNITRGDWFETGYYDGDAYVVVIYDGEVDFDACQILGNHKQFWIDDLVDDHYYFVEPNAEYNDGYAYFNTRAMAVVSSAAVDLKDCTVTGYADKYDEYYGVDGYSWGPYGEDGNPYIHWGYSSTPYTNTSHVILAIRGSQVTLEGSTTINFENDEAHDARTENGIILYDAYLFATDNVKITGDFCGVEAISSYVEIDKNVQIALNASYGAVIYGNESWNDEEMGIYAYDSYVSMEGESVINISSAAVGSDIYGVYVDSYSDFYYEGGKINLYVTRDEDYFGPVTMLSNAWGVYLEDEADMYMSGVSSITVENKVEGQAHGVYMKDDDSILKEFVMNGGYIDVDGTTAVSGIYNGNGRVDFNGGSIEVNGLTNYTYGVCVFGEGMGPFVTSRLNFRSGSIEVESEHGTGVLNNGGRVEMGTIGQEFLDNDHLDQYPSIHTTHQGAGDSKGIETVEGTTVLYAGEIKVKGNASIAVEASGGSTIVNTLQRIRTLDPKRDDAFVLIAKNEDNASIAFHAINDAQWAINGNGAYFQARAALSVWDTTETANEDMFGSSTTFGALSGGTFKGYMEVRDKFGGDSEEITKTLYDYLAANHYVRNNDENHLAGVFSNDSRDSVIIAWDQQDIAPGVGGYTYGTDKKYQIGSGSYGEWTTYTVVDAEWELRVAMELYPVSTSAAFEAATATIQNATLDQLLAYSYVSVEDANKITDAIASNVAIKLSAYILSNPTATNFQIIAERMYWQSYYEDEAADVVREFILGKLLESEIAAQSENNTFKLPCSVILGANQGLWSAVYGTDAGPNHREDLEIAQTDSSEGHVLDLNGRLLAEKYNNNVSVIKLDAEDVGCGEEQFVKLAIIDSFADTTPGAIVTDNDCVIKVYGEQSHLTIGTTSTNGAIIINPADDGYGICAESDGIGSETPNVEVNSGVILAENAIDVEDASAYIGEATIVGAEGINVYDNAVVVISGASISAVGNGINAENDSTVIILDANIESSENGINASGAAIVILNADIDAHKIGIAATDSAIMLDEINEIDIYGYKNGIVLTGNSEALISGGSIWNTGEPYAVVVKDSKLKVTAGHIENKTEYRSLTIDGNSEVVLETASEEEFYVEEVRIFDGKLDILEGNKDNPTTIFMLEAKGGDTLISGAAFKHCAGHQDIYVDGDAKVLINGNNIDNGYAPSIYVGLRTNVIAPSNIVYITDGVYGELECTFGTAYILGGVVDSVKEYGPSAKVKMTGGWTHSFDIDENSRLIAALDSDAITGIVPANFEIVKTCTSPVAITASTVFEIVNGNTTSAGVSGGSEWITVRKLHLDDVVTNGAVTLTANIDLKGDDSVTFAAFRDGEDNSITEDEIIIPLYAFEETRESGKEWTVTNDSVVKLNGFNVSNTSNGGVFYLAKNVDFTLDSGVYDENLLEKNQISPSAINAISCESGSTEGQVVISGAGIFGKVGLDRSLTVNGGYFDKLVEAYALYDGSSVVINSGIFDQTKIKADSITINDGLFTKAVALLSGGSVTINDGTFIKGIQIGYAPVTGVGGLATPFDTIVINGGEYNGWNHFCADSITINDGEFDGKQTLSASDTVTIANGTFISPDLYTEAVEIKVPDTNNLSIIIKGGSFDNDKADGVGLSITGQETPGSVAISNTSTTVFPTFGLTSGGGIKFGVAGDYVDITGGLYSTIEVPSTTSVGAMIFNPNTSLVTGAAVVGDSIDYQGHDAITGNTLMSYVGNVNKLSGEKMYAVLGKNVESMTLNGQASASNLKELAIANDVYITVSAVVLPADANTNVVWTYTGSPNLTEVSKSGTEIVLKLSTAATPGTYVVTGTSVGTQANGGGSIVKSYTVVVNPKDVYQMSSCTASLDATSFAHDGSAHQVTLSAVTHAGTPLVEGVDYTISGTYEATAIGSYSVTITGVPGSQYTGTKTLTWSIYNPTPTPPPYNPPIGPIGPIGPVGPTVVEVESVELNRTEITLPIGGTYDLIATVLPEDAEDPEVTWSAANSRIAKVTDGKVKAVAVGTTTVIASAGDLSTSVIVNVVENDFVDVLDDEWNTEPILYCAYKGLFKGNSEGEFMPTKLMTESELVTILYRVAMESEPEAVEGEAWYYTQQQWALAEALLAEFDAEKPITRGEFITMFYKAIKINGSYDTTVTTAMRNNLKSATDYASISSVDRDAIAWSVDCGLIVGTTGGELTINPNGEITRAEVATMLMRYYQGL